MYPPVPDLTSDAVQARSDGALYYIIQNGIRWTGMPAWKAEHSADETWRLVSFIRRTPTLMEADMVSEPPASEDKPREAEGGRRMLPRSGVLGESTESIERRISAKKLVPAKPRQRDLETGAANRL